jgi:ketosteroid isomerase-like protein
MEKILPRIILAVLVCTSTARGGLAGHGQRAADISRLEEQWRAAQQHNDKAAFHRLLAPDLTFVGTSGSFRDKAGYKDSRGGSWIPQSSSYNIDGLVVRFYGDTAVVTGREAATVAGVVFQARFTHVWVQRKGQWRLVAIQRTQISSDTKRGQTSNKSLQPTASRLAANFHMTRTFQSAVTRAPARCG